MVLTDETVVVVLLIFVEDVAAPSIEYKIHVPQPKPF